MDRQTLEGGFNSFSTLAGIENETWRFGGNSGCFPIFNLSSAAESPRRRYVEAWQGLPSWELLNPLAQAMPKIVSRAHAASSEAGVLKPSQAAFTSPPIYFCLCGRFLITCGRLPPCSFANPSRPETRVAPSPQDR